MTAGVTKAVAILGEYDDFLDVRELFEGGVDLSENARIGTDSWGTGGTTQVQGRRPLLGFRTFHVQGEREIRSTDGMGSRTTRWASQDAIELGEESRAPFTQGRSSYQELDGECSYRDGW